MGAGVLNLINRQFGVQRIYGVQPCAECVCLHRVQRNKVGRYILLLLLRVYRYIWHYLW